MNLYKISQNVNNKYDTYDSAIVAAENEEDAKHIHPSDYENDGDWWNDNHRDDVWGYHWSWTHPDNVEVELLAEGINRDAGVILASFNAG